MRKYKGAIDGADAPMRKKRKVRKKRKKSLSVAEKAKIEKKSQKEAFEEVKDVFKPSIFVLHNHSSLFRANLIILPIGAYYNREIQRIRVGDIVKFNDNVERVVEFSVYMPIKHSLTEYLCRKTYIGGMDIVRSRWESNAIIDGYARDAIDTDKCLMIFFKEAKDERKVE